jgi:hypothetical protein
MNLVKVLAGAFALVDSVLTIYVSFTGTLSTAYSSWGALLFWASVLLLIDSFLDIYGVHYAFVVSALLSAVLAGVSPLLLTTSWQEIIVTLLSLITLVSSVVAFRSKSMLSEQANPMNLPVFG